MQPRAFPYWHIDAFADQAFGGNPAAVFMLDQWLADDHLAAIAAEMMLPATAFLVKQVDADPPRSFWDVRWFTPGAELMLCGHASLAAGHALMQHHEADAAHSSITLRSSKSGQIEIRRIGNDQGMGNYEVRLPAIATEPRAFPEAEALLGAQPLATYRNDARYNIMLFESEKQIRALAPDLAGLAKLGNHQFACTALGSATDIVSRVFVPGAGVDEDSVTGSAHAALTPYWAERLGRDRLSAHQASARGGDLTCCLEGDHVWLGGPCTTVAEGVFYL